MVLNLMVVVLEATHGAVLTFSSEDFHYLDDSTIKMRSIVSVCIFPCHEQNTTAIRTMVPKL